MNKGKVLTKAELITCLKEQGSSLNGGLAMQLTDAFFDVISAALENGECVKFSGLGSFRVRKKGPRPGRNPKTGITTLIPSRKVVLFQASQKLKIKLKRV